MQLSISAVALGTALALALPARADTPAADAARDAQLPSPGGAGRPRALVVDRPDFQLAVRGALLLLAVPVVGADSLVASGDVADFRGLRLRRAQLGVEGRAGDRLLYDLWIDGTTPSDPLLQARLAWRFLPELQAEAGLMKPPFSRSALASSADLVFSERPLSARLVPDRQLGAGLFGAAFGGRLSYRAGWYNGAASGRAGQGNDHPGGMLAARVAAAPLGALRPGQADLERGAPRVEVAANVLRDDAAGYDGFAWGADLAAQGYGASLVLEYFQDERVPLAQPVLPPTLPDRTVRSGLVAQASYLFWRDGLELAVRAERSDDNRRVLETRAGDKVIASKEVLDEGDVFGLAAGLHWYPAGTDLRLNLDWYRREEMGGRDLDNDAVALGVQGRF